MRGDRADSAYAIVHDAFVQPGGGERVAAQLAAAFEDAPIHTAGWRPEFLPPPLTPADVRASFVQPLVGRGASLAAVAPLLPLAFARLPLGAPEAVVSSSSAFAHHVRVSSSTVHVCYCHTPPRFLWEEEEYFDGQPARRRLAAAGLAVLRSLDRAAARRVDVYVANSRHVAARIERVYGRSAEVVHPPSDTRAFAPTTERSGRFLAVARLRNHKRLDLAIEAANLASLPLDVVGTGPELESLRRLAGPTVRLLGPATDDEVRSAMARCAGLVVPTAQDFGLTMVEVQAAGRPPIAFGAGGSTEIVEDGVTGFLFGERSPQAIASAMRRAIETPLDVEAMRASAGRFDVAVFRSAIRAAVARALEGRAAERAAGRRTGQSSDPSGRPARREVVFGRLATRSEEAVRVD